MRAPELTKTASGWLHTPGPPPSTLTSALHTKGDMRVCERIIERLLFTSNLQVQSCLWDFPSWLVVDVELSAIFSNFRDFIIILTLRCPLTLCLVVEALCMSVFHE